MFAYNAFFSHNWGDRRADGMFDVHERVVRIADAVKSRGLTVWLEGLTDTTLKRMAEGIDQSECVVVFVTREYLRKVGGEDVGDKCHKEFCYAALKKSSSHMLAVVLEPECLNTHSWQGPVGIILGSGKYVDFSDDHGFEARVDMVCKEIRERNQTSVFAKPAIAAKVPPEGTGQRIYNAAYDGTYEELEALVEEWAGNDVLNWTDPEDEYRTPLHTVCRLGNLDKVLLLARTAAVDVNKGTGYYHSSPLMVAINCSQVEVVDALLKLPEVDVNHKGKGGGTALMCAVSPTDTENRLEILKMLLKAPNIDINAVATGGDWKGHSALGLALIETEEDSAEHKAELQEVVELLNTYGAIARTAPGGRRSSMHLYGSSSTLDGWGLLTESPPLIFPAGVSCLRKFAETSKSKHAFVSALRSALGQDSEALSDLVDCFSAVLDSGTEENESAALTESVETVLKEVKPAPDDSLYNILCSIKAWSFKLALKEALLVDQRPLRRSRLMIVGEGAAGKTSFFRALTGQERHKQHLSTVGLDTTDYSVQKKAELGDDSDAVREAGVEVADYESGSSSWNPLDKDLGEADRTMRLEIVRRVKSSISNQRTLPNVEKATLAQRVKAVEGIDTDAGARNAGKRTDSKSDYKGPALDTVHDSVTKAVVVEKTEEVASSKGIFNLGFNKSEAEALAFSVWDYGGQRVFQNVQHLFLSRYGVYVLAFDLTKLVADKATVDNSLTYLRYWLRQIGMIAYGAPLILLGTHVDALPDGEKSFNAINDLLLKEFSSEPAWASLQHNNEQSLCFFPVINEKSDPNISRLRHLIETCVEKDRIVKGDKESYVNLPIPLSWLKLCDELKRLEREGESYIYRDKLEEVAQNCGAFSHLAASDLPSRRLLVSSLLDRFNTLGMVVHINEPGLDDVVVLNPQWLLDLIVCIVRDFDLHKLKRDMSIKSAQLDALCKRGVLSDDVLKIFWKEEEANIPFLTKFLIKIGVMCELPRPDPTKPQLFLVPAVLSTDSVVSSRSDESLKFFSRAKITLTFQSFLPEGLLTRLVVALASQVTDYSRCDIEIEDEALGENVQIRRAPSVFTSRKSLHAAVPIGSSSQVCLFTQSGSNELTVFVLGEASLTFDAEAEAALLGEVIEKLRTVLCGVTERFYKGITFDSSVALLTNTLGKSNERAPVDIETASSVDLAEAETEAEIVEEAVESEQAFRASAEKELAEWLRTCGGVKRAEMRNAMAKVLFDAGWDGVQPLRDAFLANILDKEEADKYFALSANRAAFRAALDKEAAASKVDSSPPKVETSFGKLPQQEELPSAIVAKPDPTKLLEHQPQQFLTDVFISYAWGDRHPTGSHFPVHERVKSINAALKRRGLVTWFDSNVDSPHRMEGQMDATMAAAIENTACVIVVITELYRRKVNGSEQRDNCWKEFNYATAQVGPQHMAPVVAEASMANPRTWKGVLGMALGGKLYVNAAGLTDGPEWETTMDELCRTVKALVADAKIVVKVETCNNIPPVAEPQESPQELGTGCWDCVWRSRRG